MTEAPEILLPLEKRFPEKYRSYYGVKRNNLFAGITQCPGRDCADRFGIR